MEGLYIKVENKDEVIDRFKYVRSLFLNIILDFEIYWVNRFIIFNKFKFGVELFLLGEEV